MTGVTLLLLSATLLRPPAEPWVLLPGLVIGMAGAAACAFGVLARVGAWHARQPSPPAAIGEIIDERRRAGAGSGAARWDHPAAS